MNMSLSINEKYILQNVRILESKCRKIQLKASMNEHEALIMMI